METVLSSPFVKSFLAGSVSGTCSTLLFQPLDLLKTRLQASAGGNSDGLVVIFKNILRQDNILGLWKGTTPSIVRCVPGVGLYFSTLHTLQSTLGSSSPGNAELVGLGASARCIAGITMLPFTVVKVRFESGRFHYNNGVLGAVRTIYSCEGARGLYSGMAATLFRDAPFSGMYLLFYTNAKALIPTDYFSPNQTPVIHFSCGVLAGGLASVVTQPADVIKTHMQVDPVKFHNIRTAVKYVYTSKGAIGFMTGIVPRTMRRTLMAALAWTVYEQVMRQLGLK